MEVGDAIAIYRQRADDATFPYFVSDEAAIGFFAEAEHEAALRARLIYDDSSDILSFPIESGVDRYELDPCIFAVDCALFQGAEGLPYAIGQIGIDDLNNGFPGMTGKIRKFAFTSDNAIKVWPTPTSYDTGTLKLFVYRTPLFPVEDLGDEFEIAERHQQHLVDWVLYRTFSSKDSELYDLERAKMAEKDFTDRFGIRRSADTLRRHREKRSVTVRMPR